MKPAALLSTLFLGFIAVAHLARLALALPITVDDVAVPVWLSAPAAIATAAVPPPARSAPSGPGAGSRGSSASRRTA
jgi:hypothetical protein